MHSLRMRLLDKILQTATPFRVSVPEHSEPVTLSGAADIAPLIKEAPLRYVCDADVTALCSQAAQDFPMLSRCLDLARAPASQMWIEWDESVRIAIARGEKEIRAQSNRRAGMLIQTGESGRCGLIQSCWTSLDADGEIDVAPIIVQFDLGDPGYAANGGEDCIDLSAIAPADLRPVLSRLRFRVRPDWFRYYQQRCPGDILRRTLVRAARAVAFDFNYLMAITLLLSIEAGPLDHRRIDRSMLNRSRMARGKPALLDHVELISLMGRDSYEGHDADATGGCSRRLHIVRGHLVRRGGSVFWRRSHWRGDPLAGIVATRTVTLRRSA